MNSRVPKEACIRWGTQWLNVANTTETSICGGDAAFSQITLTTCLGHIARNTRPIATDGIAILIVTIVGPAKMAEPTETPFDMWTRVGSRKRVLDGCTLAQTGEYDRTVCARRRCGLVSNYFKPLKLFYFSHYLVSVFGSENDLL